jgi:histidine ammonia-lyase
VIEVGPALTAADVVAVAREAAPVALAPEAREAMEASARVTARHAGAAEPVYGVTTGFGMLATVPIPAARREQLQRSLVRSHAAGIG